MSSEHPPSDFGPSLTFIYFMIGFVLGVFITMVTLILIRPLLPITSFIQYIGLILPLIIGGFLGYRVAQGTKHKLPLSTAIRQALWLK